MRVPAFRFASPLFVGQFCASLNSRRRSSIPESAPSAEAEQPDRKRARVPRFRRFRPSHLRIEKQFVGATTGPKDDVDVAQSWLEQDGSGRLAAFQGGMRRSRIREGKGFPGRGLDDAGFHGSEDRIGALAVLDEVGSMRP